jgi:hypothetical protein
VIATSFLYAGFDWALNSVFLSFTSLLAGVAVLMVVGGPEDIVGSGVRKEREKKHM